MPGLGRTDTTTPDGDLRQEARERVCWHGEMLAGSDRRACTVIDISPYGARVMTDTHVALDQAVALNLGHRGVFQGEVRWHDGGLVGLKFTSAAGRLDELPAGGNEPAGARVYEWRKEPRHEVTFDGRVRSDDHDFACRVLDLSASGARLLTLEALTTGTQVSLSLAARQEHTGRVAWTIGEICGIAFDQPDSALLRLAIGS